MTPLGHLCAYEVVQVWKGESLRARMVGVGRVALVKGILGISEGYGRNLKKLRILGRS